MNRKQTTLYLKRNSMELLENLNGRSFSGKLEEILGRYRALVKDHGIDLDEDEEKILVSYLKAITELYSPSIHILLIKNLATELIDSDLAKNEAGQSLLDKVSNASLADRIAIVDKLGF